MVIRVANRQRQVPLAAELRRVRAFARCVVPLAQARPGPGEVVLPALAAVDVLFLSDRAMGRLHARFLGDPEPTDVMTFAHGEIVIGAGVAARQARAHRQSLGRELCRYVVHGLLHLNGHDDRQPAAAARMWRAQESVLRRAWREVAAAGAVC